MISLNRIYLYGLVLFITISILTFTGCASRNTSQSSRHPYHDAVLSIPYTTPLTIGITVHDQRPYVLLEEKKPSYAGTNTDLFTQKYDVTTETGRPLAADMLRSISTSFRYTGSRVNPVDAPHTDSSEAVLERLKKTGARRLFLLTLYEWKTKTLKDIKIHYDINLKIYGGDGTLLSEKRAKGKHEMEGSMAGPFRVTKMMVPEGYKQILESLLNEYDISRALTR